MYGSDEKHVYVLMCLSFEKRHCVRVIPFVTRWSCQVPTLILPWPVRGFTRGDPLNLIWCPDRIQSDNLRYDGPMYSTSLTHTPTQQTPKKIELALFVSMLLPSNC